MSDHESLCPCHNLFPEQFCTSITSISAPTESSPSLTIIEQKGQPTATVSQPVSASSLALISFTRLSASSSIHICAPPAPQQKESFHSSQSRHLLRQSHPRLIDDPSYSSQVAWVVESNAATILLNLGSFPPPVILLESPNDGIPPTLLRHSPRTLFQVYGSNADKRQ